jgi:hypothetical protein
MRKKLITLIAAGLLGLGIVTLAPAPAQAYGWSGQRCDNQASANAARVCAQVHTAQTSSGARVDQIQVCAYKMPQTYYNGFQGTKTNYAQYWGSGGAFLGGDNLNSTGASNGGSCSLTNVYAKMGNGACYVVMGTLDLLLANDGSYYIRGSILGGAC